PSVMKTSAVDAALGPLKRLAAEALDAHRAALAEYRASGDVAKARRDGLKDKIRRAARDGEAIDAVASEYRAVEDDAKPTERRYIVNDSTVEMLGKLLNENPTGLLHYRDELGGFLETMEREGHENDRAFYCEAWSGLVGPYSYDRIGRGTLHVAALCV